jgi:hypothetical protein
MPRRLRFVLCFPILLVHGAAPAQQARERPLQQVEVKGPGASQRRRSAREGQV